MRILIDPQCCFPSHLSPIPEHQGAQSITTSYGQLGEGGQGSVFEVTEIDGKRQRGLVVKLFSSGTPANLRELVSALRTQDANQKINNTVSLQALPLFLFTGTVSGQRISGYVMRKAEGRKLSNILETELNKYINLPLEERLAYCLQFVEGMYVLYALTIVHADLNGQNIIVDSNAKQLAIIDVDGGAVARHGAKPIVVKQEPGWLAPEIIAQLTRARTRRKLDILISADLWSIASGVHHLLFGLAPFFFIERMPEIDTYLGRYEWPKMQGLDGIATRNHQAFSYYERVFNRVPKLHKLFRAAFQEGYGAPPRRPSAYEWVLAIKEELAQYPTVEPTVPKTQLTSAKASSPKGAAIPQPGAIPFRGTSMMGSPIKAPKSNPRKKMMLTAAGIASLLLIISLFGASLLKMADWMGHSLNLSSSEQLNSPVMEFLRMDPLNAIQLGEYVTLSWRVRGAQTITISPGVGKVNAEGSVRVKPTESGFYYFYDENGKEITGIWVAVRGRPPGSNALDKADPQIINVGEIVTYALGTYDTSTTIESPGSNRVWVKYLHSISSYVTARMLQEIERLNDCLVRLPPRKKRTTVLSTTVRQNGNSNATIIYYTKMKLDGNAYTSFGQFRVEFLEIRVDLQRSSTGWRVNRTTQLDSLNFGCERSR